MVELCNVNKLEKVLFNAERAQVNRVQLNVICWLSKAKMENLGHLSIGRSYQRHSILLDKPLPNKECITLPDLQLTSHF
jgi:hypothetical protein